MSKEISVKFKVEKKIKLSSGDELIIKKLKSGKFYEAQKIYSEWFSIILDILSKREDINFNDFIDKDGKADSDKIQNTLNKKQSNQYGFIKEIYDNTEEVVTKKLELVSFCIGVSKEDLGELYYQEDIELILNTVIELNNFSENLKNFVAPMAGLGATK